MKTFVSKLIFYLPYLVPLAVGLFILLLSLFTEGRISDLLVNLSAGLFTVPLVIFTYEKIKDSMILKRNKSVIDYSIMNVDREIITILNKIQDLTTGKHIINSQSIKKFLEVTPTQLERLIKDNRVMRFYLEIEWEVYEKKISSLLSDQLIYTNLNLEERNLLIQIIAAVRHIEKSSARRFYMPEGSPVRKFEVVKSKTIDSNAQPNHYVLLKKIGNLVNYQVITANYLKKSTLKNDELITLMRINNEGAARLTNSILIFNKLIQVWIDLHDGEILIDDRNFK